MQYSLDTDCLATVEPTSSDFGDAMNVGMGDEMLVCPSVATE